MNWKALLWPQLGATLEALEKAIHACPDELWGDRVDRYEFWYGVYHVLFWTDVHVFGTDDGFHPPEPFDLGELG